MPDEAKLPDVPVPPSFGIAEAFPDGGVMMMNTNHLDFYHRITRGIRPNHYA